MNTIDIQICIPEHDAENIRIDAKYLMILLRELHKDADIRIITDHNAEKI